jgi:hypothetical protein
VRNPLMMDPVLMMLGIVVCALLLSAFWGSGLLRTRRQREP